MVPVIEGSVTALDSDNQPAQQLRLVGLDLLSLANLPDLVENKIDFGQDEASWYDWLGSENQVWIGQTTAEKIGVKEGGEVTILASGRRQQMRVRKILKQEGSALPDDLVIADIPTVQSLLSRPREINRVEVVLSQSRSSPGY